MSNDAIPLFAVLMAVGLVSPPPLFGSAMLAMSLCNGGVVLVPRGGKPAPAEPKGACHAICACRRDDDETAKA